MSAVALKHCEKYPMHVYEVRPRKDHRGVDLICDALLFGGLWYTKPDDAVDYARFFSRSHDAVIHFYDAARNVIQAREHTGDFQEAPALASNGVTKALRDLTIETLLVAT